MRVGSFADIAAAFKTRVERTVWSTMATVDRRGRPRSRIVHPIWDGHVGWLLTGRTSLKGRHLDREPHASFTYWDQTNEQVHVECRTTWIDDPAARQEIWDLFKSTPPPVGYDPGLFFDKPSDPSVGVARLDPWRIELWSIGDLMQGRPTQVWVPA